MLGTRYSNTDTEFESDSSTEYRTRCRNRVSGAGVLESDAEYSDSVSVFIIRNADSVSKFASSGMLLGDSNHVECGIYQASAVGLAFPERGVVGVT